MSYVIFTIDFENNPHRMNVFKNYLAECQRSPACMTVPVNMIGCYKGQKEQSFIWGADDFNLFLRGSVYVAGQESILHVASGNKMEAVLEYLADGRREPLGCMHEVCREEAMQSESWTYRPDMDTYWIAKVGNPDDSLKRSVAEYSRKPLDVPHDWHEQASIAAE